MLNLTYECDFFFFLFVVLNTKNLIFSILDVSALRVSIADVSNMPNAKYLAHLAHQTQKMEHYQMC